MHYLCIGNNIEYLTLLHLYEMDSSIQKSCDSENSKNRVTDRTVTVAHSQPQIFEKNSTRVVGSFRCYS